jgi:hypothetical protein
MQELGFPLFLSQLELKVELII